MAEAFRLLTYLQLAVPFTVAPLRLPTDSRRWRFTAMWIAGWSVPLLAALVLVCGIELPLLPVVATCLWTVWQWIRATLST